MAGVAVSSALGQAGEAAPAASPPQRTLPPIRIGGRGMVARPRSPDVLAAPPAADFLVIPLRAHILRAPDIPAIDCALTDADIRRVIGKVNTIWHKAGIHWALDSIVHEPAARQRRYLLAGQDGVTDPFSALRLLVPDATRLDLGMDVYYVHDFEANGIFLGDRTAFVRETAQLFAVPGGIDEPLPRVTAHELAHALGLPHREDETNLLASGRSGTILNQLEVDQARERAPLVPGAATVPDLRRQRDDAQGRHDAAEVARIDAILAAIPDDKPPAAP